MNGEQAREVLAAGLPAVSLLLGPGSLHLGRTLCAEHDGVVVEKLTAETARMVRDSVHVMAPGGLVYLILMKDATEQAQNILLKVLEEPPAHVRFILAGYTAPLPTIVSRCQVFAFGGLAESSKDGPETARVRGTVGSVARAALAGNWAAVDGAARGWTPEHTRQLAAWASEIASGRWDRFGADFAPGVSVSQALNLLATLSLYDGARTGWLVALRKLLPQG